MRKWAKFAGILLILAVLCGCGKERPVERAPQEPPFQLTFDPEQYTLAWESDAWYLRPILTELNSVYPDEIQANERYNQKLFQCSIAIRQLEQPAAEAAAADRQNALEQWLVVTELEAIPALNGVGYFVVQQNVEDDIFAEYRVFAPDPQGDCFQLIAHFKMHLGTIDRQFWEIIQSFRTDASTQTIPAVERPIGEVRSTIAYGNSWQEAYLKILFTPQDYLMDLDHWRSGHLAEWGLDPYFYLGIHDFDLDGVPELIIGDGISLGVFTYADGKTTKLADLCDTESPWCVNGVRFDNHVICAECAGAGTRSCVMFGYVDGQYQLAIYSTMSGPRLIINEKPCTLEDIKHIYPSIDEYDNESLWCYRVKRAYIDDSLCVEASDGTWMPVDENFDFNSFSW